MKVDANGVHAYAPGATVAPGRGQDDRWLAQLERAYLDTVHADALPSRGAADEREGSPADERARGAQAAEESPATTVAPVPSPPAWSVSSAGPSLPTCAPPVQPPGGAYAAFAPQGPYGESLTAREGDVGTGQRATVLQSPVASPSPGRSLRLASDAADTLAGPPAGPARYAKQFMQLSVSDAAQAQASVRDASLSAAGEIAVAHAVASQLRSDGVELQRVFVNGRRFDADTLRRAAPLFPILTNYTQE